MLVFMGEIRVIQTQHCHYSDRNWDSSLELHHNRSSLRSCSHLPIHILIWAWKSGV